MQVQEASASDGISGEFPEAMYGNVLNGHLEYAEEDRQDNSKCCGMKESNDW